MALYLSTHSGAFTSENSEPFIFPIPSINILSLQHIFLKYQNCYHNTFWVIPDFFKTSQYAYSCRLLFYYFATNFLYTQTTYIYTYIFTINLTNIHSETCPFTIYHNNIFNFSKPNTTTYHKTNAFSQNSLHTLTRTSVSAAPLYIKCLCSEQT